MRALKLGKRNKSPLSKELNIKMAGKKDFDNILFPERIIKIFKNNEDVEKTYVVK